MTRPAAPRRVWPWVLLAALAPAAVLAAYVATRAGGEVSALYFVTPEAYERSVLHERYARERLRTSTTLYDSAVFLMLANDPTLAAARRLGARPTDVFYRGQRMLFPWLGWALAAGRPEAILHTLPAVAVAALALGAAVVARVAAAHGRAPAVALLYPASLGAAVTLQRPLADMLATSLVLLGCAAWWARRFRSAALVFTAALLAKETTILVAAVLGAAHVAGRSSGAAAGDGLARRWAQAAWLGIVPTVLVLWWAYLTGGEPAALVGGSSSLGPPLVGLVHHVRRIAEHPAAFDAVLLGAVAVSLVTVVLCRPGGWHGVRYAALALVVLALCVSAPVWQEHWAYGRAHATVPALALLLYARDGRRLDLVGPIACAAAGALAWVEAFSR